MTLHKTSFIKVKNLINYLGFLLIDILLSGKGNNVPNSLLIVRLDAIGDYILFRNFIEILKKSKKYGSYKITLCGNIIWKELAETLDKNFIDNFIWTDRKKFYANLFYKYKILKMIHDYGFESAIETTYSREILYGDEIIKVSRAKKRIGSKGSLDKHAKWKRNLFSDKWYTQLITSSNENIFEFLRNKEFFQHLLETEIDIKKAVINVSGLSFIGFQSRRYIVLFPGASSPERRWDINNFLIVAKHILENTSYDIIIDGSKKETGIAHNIQNKLKSERLFVTAGLTKLSDMAKLLAGAELLISNETSAVHFAAAVNTKFICISNGVYYNRFHPYPEEVFSGANYVYPPEILESNKFNPENYRFKSGLDINKIKPEKVIDLLDKLISKN